MKTDKALSKIDDNPGKVHFPYAEIETKAKKKPFIGSVD
jgi:hypothetical protein